ncbi:hypothetical protein FCV25MIE_18470, partial [Fagus crenata]
ASTTPICPVDSHVGDVSGPFSYVELDEEVPREITETTEDSYVGDVSGPFSCAELDEEVPREITETMEVSPKTDITLLPEIKRHSSS